MRLSLIFAVVACLCLSTRRAPAACDALPPPGAAAVTYVQVQSLFAQNCAVSGCHSNFSVPDLSSSASYSQIVNVPSFETALVLVKPGDPVNSYLFQKINCDAPASGRRMPLGGSALSIADQALIRDWIVQGAPKSVVAPGSPIITSGPTATPPVVSVGQTVTLFAMASDPGGGALIYTWDLGDSSIGAGPQTTHIYTAAGTYTVTLTVTNALGLTTTATTTVTVTGGSTGNPGSIVPTSLALAKVSIHLNFAKGGTDSVALSGTIAVPDNFAVSAQFVSFNVGGIMKSFALDAKGASPAGTADSFKLIVRNKKGVVSAQTAPFRCKFSKGDFAATLVSSGLVGTTSLKLAPVTVNILISFNLRPFQTSEPLKYTVRTGKTGMAKS